jgi:hypothetical protein
MKPLDSIVVEHQLHDKIIEIMHGDLTAMTDGLRYDVLVVSAFPGDYQPTANSLVGALGRKGVSMEDLATRKAYDLRREFSCWLSEPIPESAGLPYGRILCFEPPQGGSSPAERVDDIFRALAPFIGLREMPVTSVAMPLIACGDMGTPIRDMVRPLIEAATHWMRTSPLHHIRVAEFDEVRARKLGRAVKRIKAEILAAQTSEQKTHDVFLSYCRANTAVADVVEQILGGIAPGVRVFRDIRSLNTGKDYRVQLDRAVRSARRFVPLLTAEYVASKACQDEFNAAWFIRERMDPDLFFPIIAHDTTLEDPRMSRLQYDDCREADHGKLRESCQKLAASLGWNLV